MKLNHLVVTALLLAISVAAQARGGHSGGHGGGGRSGGGHSGGSSSGTGASHAKQHVSGYSKKTGKRVKAHNRSKADNTQRDNWDTKGNVNPDTGKPGSKNAK